MSHLPFCMVSWRRFAGAAAATGHKRREHRQAIVRTLESDLLSPPPPPSLPPRALSISCAMPTSVSSVFEPSLLGQQCIQRRSWPLVDRREHGARHFTPRLSRPHMTPNTRRRPAARCMPHGRTDQSAGSAFCLASEIRWGQQRHGTRARSGFAVVRVCVLGVITSASPS